MRPPEEISDIIRVIAPSSQGAAGQIALTILVAMIEQGLLTPAVLARASNLVRETRSKDKNDVCDHLATLIERVIKQKDPETRPGRR